MKRVRVLIITFFLDRCIEIRLFSSVVDHSLIADRNRDPLLLHALLGLCGLIQKPTNPQRENKKNGTVTAKGSFEIFMTADYCEIEAKTKRARALLPKREYIKETLSSQRFVRVERTQSQEPHFIEEKAS